MGAAPILAVPRRFVTTGLPWLAGTGGLLVYLFTLNHWVPLNGVGVVARVSGWAWQPALSQPLTWAVLYPFRWLPPAWIPLALNCFTAVCASLVLVLLARSVALLPHDVARDDPFHPASEGAILTGTTAWMPPALAALVCGLQLSFWEHATSATGAMIDLLLFACILRCLLEFRIDRDEAWLARCACIYGAGMANDWVLVAYLPVFVAALVRITGFGVIYNRRLLRRTALWGLAGLSAYLWLPALHAVAGDANTGFWVALKANLKPQRDALRMLRGPAFRVLAVTALLPLLVLTVRWKSHTVQFGDDTPLGVFFTRATVRFVHALIFAVALWLGLDPTFSPRHLGLGLPMLSYYYLSAMVAGYCAGYFLAMGSRAVEEVRAKGIRPPRGAGMGDPQARDRLLATVAAVAVWIALGALPLALLARNFSQLRITNGPAVHEFARQLCADLPAGRSVVLSEDARQLVLLRAELSVRANGKEVLPLETLSLNSAQYHRFMAKQFPARWPVAVPAQGRVSPAEMVKLVAAFAAQGEVVYAHPSSGLFFERFQDQPNGLVHGLLRRETKTKEPLRIEPGLAVTNELIWQQRWRGMLAGLAEQAKAKPQCGPRWAWPLLAKLRLRGEQNLTASALGAVYSKALDCWGVQMQRLGRWAEAGAWFDHALALNPDNLSAQINAEYNQHRQRGDLKPLEAAVVEKEFGDLLAAYRNWGEILNANGPVDEPTFLLRAARAYLPGGSYRQTAEQLTRCSELAPDWAEPKLWLALDEIDQKDFAAALELADRVRSSVPSQDGAELAQLLMCRTTALQGLGRTNEAAACLNDFISRYREHADVLATAAELLERNHQFQKELAVLNELVRQEPDNGERLAKKGWCELQLARFAAAAATLTEVLARDPSNAEAHLHRAAALLGADQLDAAREEYRELLKTARYSQNALLGLGAIAWRKQDTNAAVGLYQQYLANGTPGSPEYALVAARLNRLQGKQGGR